MAIQQCGGEPETGYRYTAYSHFNRNTEMEKERYAKTVKLYGKSMEKNNTEAAGRSLPPFITICTGKRNPAVHR